MVFLISRTRYASRVPSLVNAGFDDSSRPMGLSYSKGETVTCSGGCQIYPEAGVCEHVPDDHAGMSGKSVEAGSCGGWYHQVMTDLARSKMLHSQLHASI
jgi:hypothetical protein